jgi:hypothetical protein
MANSVSCPQCGQADQVEKVSSLYVYGIEKKWGRRRSDPSQNRTPSSSRSAFLEEMPEAELLTLSRRLAPPAAKKESGLQPIHPDLIVLAFSLVAPIFLYGILTSQSGGLVYVLPLLAAFYGFYFWKRRELITKFQAQQDARQAAKVQVKHGLQRWMSLYYCARDDGVFKPGAGELTPADQLAGFLLKE